MKCPVCRLHQLVEINLKIRGEDVILRSCSVCDLRSWEGLEGRMPLSSLLDLATRPSPAAA